VPVQQACGSDQVPPECKLNDRPRACGSLAAQAVSAWYADTRCACVVPLYIRMQPATQRNADTGTVSGQFCLSGRGQVLLDCGGQEGSLAPALLAALAVLSPNETELARLTGASRQLMSESERGRCRSILYFHKECLLWL